MEKMRETLLQMTLVDWLWAVGILILVIAAIHFVPWFPRRRLLADDDPQGTRRRSFTAWFLDYAIWPPWLERPNRPGDSLPLEVIRGENENEDQGLTRQQWRAMINRPGGGRWIGRAEVTFFYAALVAGAPQAIAVWLAFKVAAKWETWKNIVHWPERLPGEPEQPSGKNGEDDENLQPSAGGDEYDAALAASYVGARNLIGGWLHGRFVLGTILNIIWAFAVYALYLKSPAICEWALRSACALVSSSGP